MDLITARINKGHAVQMLIILYWMGHWLEISQFAGGPGGAKEKGREKFGRALFQNENLSLYYFSFDWTSDSTNCVF